MMSLVEIYAGEFRDGFADSVRKAHNLKPTDNWISAYHGTKESSARNIEKTGFRVGSWFTTDPDEARRYAMATGTKNPYVMQVRLYVGSIIPSGKYLVSNERLYSTSAGFVPKDLIPKVHSL